MPWTGAFVKPGTAAALFGLLAALLLRAMVPSGYMVATGADGAVSLIPCSVAAPGIPSDPPAHGAHQTSPAAASHHAETAEASHHAQAGHEQDDAPAAGIKCPYTALLAPPLPATPPLIAPPAPAPLPAALPPDPVAVRVTPAAPPPPATGPPVLI